VVEIAAEPVPCPCFVRQPARNRGSSPVDRNRAATRSSRHTQFRPGSTPCGASSASRSQALGPVAIIEIDGEIAAVASAETRVDLPEPDMPVYKTRTMTSDQATHTRRRTTSRMTTQGEGQPRPDYPRVSQPLSPRHDLAARMSVARQPGAARGATAAPSERPHFGPAS
jgi:hypothetical protein